MDVEPTTLRAIRETVRARSGIALDPAKDYLLVSRLRPLLARFGLASLEDLAGRIAAGPSPLLRAAVDAVLAADARFFRDGAQFDALRDVVLPPLIERRAAARSLRLWSASASTGQEPYSLAILLREHFPGLAGWDVRVLGTDLSAESLRRAEAACFSQLEVNRGVSPRLLARHFRRDGLAWQVHPDVRALVELRALNLAKRAWPALPRFDVVFLRGALRYLDPRRRAEVIGRVRSVLAPDGFLFLGAGDAAPGPAQGFEAIEVGDATFFRPVAVAAPLPATPPRPAEPRPTEGA